MTLVTVAMQSELNKANYSPNSTCCVTTRHDTLSSQCIFAQEKVVTCCLAFVGQHGATRSSRLADARHVFMGVHLNFSKVVPAIDANPEHRVLNLYTRALLLLPRPPCWNKHGATRTTRRACHVVTWCNKWNLGLSRMHSARAACTTMYDRFRLLVKVDHRSCTYCSYVHQSSRSSRSIRHIESALTCTDQIRIETDPTHTLMHARIHTGVNNASFSIFYSLFTYVHRSWAEQHTVTYCWWGVS